MHDLKERFEPVKLSDAQKERILNNVDKPVRPHIPKGPLFASVIVGLAMLFLMFNLLIEPETILQPGSNQAAEQGQLDINLSWKMISWNVVATVLMILSMLATRRAITQVKRWQSNRNVQKLKKIVASKPKFLSCIIMFAVIIWGGSYLFNWSLIYAHIWVVTFYVLGFFMLEVYQTRNLEKTSCPHCGIQFTRKQVRQKVKWQYREKCDTCEKPIYVDPKRNGSSAFIVYPSFLVFYSILDMHYLIVVVMMCSILWLIMKYISPYSIQFVAEKKDDPKMW